MTYDKYSVDETKSLEVLVYKMTKEYKDGKKKDTTDKTYPPYRSDFMKAVRDIPHIKKDGTPSATIKMFPNTRRTDRSILTHVRQYILKKHKELGADLRLPAIQKPAPQVAGPVRKTKDELLKERMANLKKEYGV